METCSLGRRVTRAMPTFTGDSKKHCAALSFLPPYIAGRRAHQLGTEPTLEPIRPGL